VGTRGNDPKTDSALITNKEQLIYCFILPDLNASGSGGTATRNDWSSLGMNNVTSKMAQGKKGWYGILESQPDSNYLPEYSSAQPEFFDGDVYFATFMQEKINLDDADDKCADSAVRGRSRIYALDMSSGIGDRWKDGDKYVEIEGGKVLGFTNSVEGDDESLLVTIEIQDELKYLESLTAIQATQEDVRGVYSMDSGGGHRRKTDILRIRKKKRRRIPLKPGTSLTNYYIWR
jgi:hypothetical protein